MVFTLKGNEACTIKKKIYTWGSKAKKEQSEFILDNIVCARVRALEFLPLVGRFMPQKI